MRVFYFVHLKIADAEIRISDLGFRFRLYLVHCDVRRLSVLVVLFVHVICFLIANAEIRISDLGFQLGF
jgi:hypothetical protein